MRGDEDTKAELHQQLDVCNIIIIHVIFFSICVFCQVFTSVWLHRGRNRIRLNFDNYIILLSLCDIYFLTYENI